jgi:hypothetical protein
VQDSALFGSAVRRFMECPLDTCCLYVKTYGKEAEIDH